MTYRPPGGRGGVGATIATAAIGAVALLATVLVLVTNDDENARIVGGAPPPTGYSASTGDAGAGAGATRAGSGARPTSSITKAYVESHFPLPPGGRPDPHVTPPRHQLWYVTNTPLETVRTFYLDAFKSLGFTCDLAAGSDPTFPGYACAFSAPGNPDADLGRMQVRHHITDYPRNLVLVQAFFDL